MRSIRVGEGYADPDTGDDFLHGNYFGIYSVVNYLGNLTSDVHFTDDRRYVEKGLVHESTGTSYYDWKTSHLEKRDRNNGTSYNQVALASGVFLELTSENSTPSNKIYGDITGVVELDLINVKKDIEGGGYVYARNEHGLRSEVSHVNTLLSEYNQKNGDETDKDCGGSCSQKCDDGEGCQSNADCLSDVCTMNACVGGAPDGLSLQSLLSMK